jgi:hypothetical protein
LLGLALRSLALLGLAVLVLLVVNAFDEDLAPGVVELLKPAAAEVDDGDNAYYALVGLDAPSGADPHAHGRQLVARMVAEETRRDRVSRAERSRPAQQKLRRLLQATTELETRQETLRIKPSKYLCSRAAQDSCLRRVSRNPVEAKRALDENRELLERYRRLLKYPALVETYVPRDFLGRPPELSAFHGAHNLWLTHVALEFENGNLQAAFADLESDMALLRAALKGTRLSPTRVGILIALQMDLPLLAEMVVAKPAAAASFKKEIAAALAPLTPAELSWARLERETLASIVPILQARPGTAYEWVASPFLKRHATVNRLYAAQKTIYEWNEFSASQDEAMRQRVARANDMLHAPYWTFAYNPVGKWELRDMDLSHYIDVMESYYDLDGLRRLVLLATTLAGLPAAEIPAAIGKTDPGMKWDADRKQVYFEPRSTFWRDHEGQRVGGVKGRIGISVVP